MNVEDFVKQFLGAQSRSSSSACVPIDFRLIIVGTFCIKIQVYRLDQFPLYEIVGGIVSSTIAKTHTTPKPDRDGTNRTVVVASAYPQSKDAKVVLAVQDSNPRQ